jgi:hypothetical protein
VAASAGNKNGHASRIDSETELAAANAQDLCEGG